MPFKVLEIQPTPNPNAKKLLLDRTISDSPLSYRTREAAQESLLATQLMEINGVVGVLILHDFVTISKSSDARWADITNKAKRILARAEVTNASLRKGT